MRRRRPIWSLPVAASALLFLLVGGAWQAGPAEGLRAPHALVTARTNAVALILGSLRYRVDGLASVLDGVRARVEDVRTRMGDRRTEAAEAKAALRRDQRELDRWTAAARSELAAGATLAPTSRRAASTPLESVAGALHASDRLLTRLLSQIASTRELETDLDHLLTAIGSEQRRLVALEYELQAQLSGARRLREGVRVGSAGPGNLEDVEVLVGHVQSELHDAQIEQMELRRLEAELLAQRAAQAEAEKELAGELAEAREQVEGLYVAMGDAESIVAAWAPWLSSFDLSHRVGGGGVFRVCPVDEPRAYSDDWGAPRWAGGFHLHQGNDIFAPEGTPIRAPFDGVAVTSDNTLGGTAVTVHGRAGYVYNAHLSAYGQLGPVTAGTIIGYVGNTGDAVGSPPHDHFEWHPGDGPAIDPFPYLNAVC